MNKIIEVIHNNVDVRTYALTKVICEGYIGGAYDTPNIKTISQQALYALTKDFAAIDSIRISRTEISVNISNAFRSEEGWTMIREFIMPIIRALFQMDDAEYHLRDDTDKHQRFAGFTDQD